MSGKKFRRPALPVSKPEGPPVEIRHAGDRRLVGRRSGQLQPAKELCREGRGGGDDRFALCSIEKARGLSTLVDLVR